MGCSLFPPRDRRPQLLVEVLEGRDCPAVSATLSDGTLLVTGDAGPDQVSVVVLVDNVVEVFDRGVGFAPFAGVESIVIKTFGGPDRVEYGPTSAAVVGDLGDPILNIDVGAGDDLVIVRDHTPVITRTFTVRNSNTSIDLGTGRDFVRVEFNQSSDVALDVYSADGGDDVGAVIGVPGRQKWSPIELKRGKVTMDLGAGDNRVSVATGNVDDVEVNVKTSGRDGYSFSFNGTEAPSAIDGQSWFGLNSGAKKGGADDRVTIEAGGFADVSTAIDTRAGNDWVTAKYRLMRPRPSDAASHVAFDARLGDGDDRLDAWFAGYDTADLGVDLGAGNDRGNVQIGTWITDVTYERLVSVNAQLGTGDDSLRLRTRGYDEVRAVLDTGPDGDGRDQVSAAFVLPGEPTAGPRNLVSLHSCDLDRFDVLGIGYPTADITLTGHQCLVHFLGGIP